MASLAFELPGSLRSKFQLLEVLGGGAQATVVRAHQRELDRPVILKLIEIGATSDDEAAARAHREARTLASLDHPCIVQLLDYDVVPPWVCLAYPDDGGRALSDPRQGEDWDSPEQLRRLLTQVLEGLGAAHEAGVLHRDIKPANLLTYDDGSVKLIDFGLALNQDATRLTGTGLFLGTPLYSPPEKVAQMPDDARGDLYAVGVLAYELATGENPFRASNIGDILQRHLAYEPPPLATVRGDLDPGVTDLVDALLAKDPEERPQSAREALEWLHHADTAPRGPGSVATATGVLPPPEPPASGSAARPRPSGASTSAPVATHPARHPVWIGLLLVLASLATLQLLTRDPPPPVPRPGETPPEVAPGTFDAEAWAEALREQLDEARDRFVDSQGGLVRSLNGERPPGTVPLLEASPHQHHLVFQALPAYPRARAALAAGLRPHALPEADRRRILEAEAPLRAAGLPAPLGPFTEVRPGASGPGPTGSVAYPVRLLEEVASPWKDALWRAVGELQAELERTDAYLRGPAPSEGSRYAHLYSLFALRQSFATSDRFATLLLGEMVLAFEERRQDYARFVQPALTAYRQALYACLRGIEDEPRHALRYALSAQRLMDWLSQVADAALPSLPEELLAGPPHREGPGALLCGYLYYQRARLLRLASRLVDDDHTARIAEAEERCGGCLTAVARDHGEGPIAEEFEARAFRMLWETPSYWVSLSRLDEWVEATLGWVRRQPSSASVSIVADMIQRLQRRERLDLHRAEIRALLREERLRAEVERRRATLEADRRAALRSVAPTLALAP